MKKTISMAIIALGIVGILSGGAFAGEAGTHYVNGVEGLKAASLPPPGFYYRMYNVLYTADALTDDNGDEIDAINFDVSVFANVHRLIWMSNYKIWGADFGADIIIPLINTDIEVKAKGGPTLTDDSQFSLGDICLEPFLLSWHGPRYDAAAALAVYIPTGDYDKTEAASPGKDMWTGMFTLGGTLYFDAEKTWSASILGRYETHSEQGDRDVTYGDDFHFEWGVAKTFNKFWDVGLAGYSQWQISDDSGSDVTWDKSVHDTIHAIGPEVNIFAPSWKLFVSLRILGEFGAEDRSEGNITTLTLTKIF